VIDSLDTDVLILGAGGAGLTAALHATDASPRLRVTVVVKGLLGRAGCTRMVQGGYNAVFTEPDSLDAHLRDTLAGGGFINDQELVWTLVTGRPAASSSWVALAACSSHAEGASTEAVRRPDHDRTIHRATSPASRS
jgi:succinate dehydrogenase / fumarate reductase flavoprotein subunit/fumarate reductase flavoprotein subunit